jgi:hypothetical protein
VLTAGWGETWVGVVSIWDGGSSVSNEVLGRQAVSPRIMEIAMNWMATDLKVIIEKFVW